MSDDRLKETCFFKGRNNIIVDVKSYERFGYIEVGDDRHMNGLDAPASLDRAGAEWLIRALQEHFKL